MSAIALAERIDRLVELGAAFVTEAEDHVIVSNLGAAEAADLRARCEELVWDCEIYDREDEPCQAAPDPDFGPFRIKFRKPAAQAGIVRILTNNAFSRWLQSEHVFSQWQVARLPGTIATQARVFTPWDVVQAVAAPIAQTKSPRALVREYAAVRKVPDDIRVWLCEPIPPAMFTHPTVQVWVRAASTALVLSMPNEIDPLDGVLKFRGPPRLNLPPLEASLDIETFEDAQNALRWVFENDREAEMRHILLTTELARSSATVISTARFLRDHLADAWESAQIAYQMAIADTSRDTLKVLGDLRKAITDETAKLSELNRQLAASVAAALATGIGLIAARVAANPPIGLIAAVMIVVGLYVLIVIFSGVQFIRLQRQLRESWQPKLYRFLPSGEYENMVTTPAMQAERSFFSISWLGAGAVLILGVVCLRPDLISDSVKKTLTSQPAPKEAAARGPERPDATRNQKVDRSKTPSKPGRHVPQETKGSQEVPSPQKNAD